MKNLILIKFVIKDIFPYFKFFEVKTTGLNIDKDFMKEFFSP